MKKILAILALCIASAAPSFAQAHKFIDVSVPDPTNFTLVPPTAMAQFPTGGFFAQYIVNVPAGMTGLSLQFSSNSGGTDALIMNTSCSPSPFEADTVMLSLPFLPVGRATNTAYTFIPGLQTIAPIGPLAGQQSIITFPVLGCARIDIALQNQSGTATDLVTVQGNFTTSTAPLFPGGTTGTFMLGITANGVPAPVHTDLGGNTTVTANSSPVDDPTIVSNSANANFPLATISGVAGALPVKQMAQSFHYTGNAITTVGTNATAKWVHTVTINTGVAGTFTIWNLATASCTGSPVGNVIAVITLTATMAPVTLPYDFIVSAGICVQASVAGADITIAYN